MIVDMPRVKAKPFTPPTAIRYSTAAASISTVSADRIVRLARDQALGTALRTVRPSFTSSFRRSKNTTNESAVIPMATMNPATPARLNVYPKLRPSSTSEANTMTAETTRLSTTTMPSAR
jgi:hypothetical protein